MIVFGLSGSHSDRVCVEGYWGVVGGGWWVGRVGGGGGWWGAGGGGWVGGS